MKTPIPPKLATLLSRLRERGEVRRAGGEWRARCPSHDDGSPSLYVRLSLDGRNSLLHCKAGCDVEDIVAALDLTLEDLFHDGDELVEVDDAFEVLDVATPVENVNGAGASVGPGPAAGSTGLAGDPAPVIAEPDVLDRVYGRLLSSLTLSDTHRGDLRRRGLADAAIDNLGYRSLERFALNQAVGRLKSEFDDATLLGVPGFRRRKGRVRFVDVEGLLVPVRDPGGRVVALKVRPGRGDSKYLWVSSAEDGGPSPGSPPHAPLGTPPQAPTVRLTEGELKADISAALSGVPTVGVSGVSNWRPCLPILKALGATTVHLAFDADARDKPAVGRELGACAEVLIEKGFEVRLELWDLADGKGIDDLLAAGKQPEIVTGQKVLAAIARTTNSSGTDQAADDEEDWVPADGAGAVAPFPTDCLPAPVARFVTEAAGAIQCPADFPGMGVLVVAAAAIGGSRRLRVRRGYEEGPRLYAAVVARPGDGKSPALRAACDPVYELQERRSDRYRKDKEQYEADLEAYESARRKMLREDDVPLNLPDKPVRPAMGHVFVGDITAEGLAQILAWTPRGVLLIRDELTGWVLSLNAYRGGKGADRQFYLSCWSGEPAKVDRKSDKGEPLVIPDPTLSVLGCIPPAKLAELDAGNDGEDGFIHRILFTFPEPVPRRRWSWHGLSPATKKAWDDVVARLYGLPMGRDEHGQPAARVLDLAPEACRAWERWYNEHAEESEAADFPEALVGPWSKLIAYAARLALVVHLLRAACGEPVGDDVDAESLARALRLVGYFKSHARKVYARLRQSAKAGRVRQAIAWVRAHGGECNPTHLARNNVAGVEGKSEAEELMKEMEDRGYGRRERRRAGNNRQVTWFVAKAAGSGPSRLKSGGLPD